jgi:hypothetical protein
VRARVNGELQGVEDLQQLDGEVVELAALLEALARILAHRVR